MRVLVACEFSGIVRDAFKDRGHDAWSCDLLPTERPGNHIQGDVLDILNDGWDVMIAHPPCTFISYAGTHCWNDEGRVWKRLEALKFFAQLWTAPIDKICIENPISVISSKIRKPDQIVQPWMFGHPKSKATCFWLKGLPLLKETDNVKADFDKLPKSKQQRLHYLPPSKDRAKIRSKTFLGIARAMADQWGK